MTNVADWIEEELGLEVTAEQRRIIDAMFPPPPPYVPPKQPWHRRVLRWFKRRKQSQSLANFDKALRDVYGPAMREHINQHSVLYRGLTKNAGEAPRQAVWTVKP